MNTLQTIIDHGLSVRRIPLEVVSLSELQHAKEDSEIVEYPTDPTYAAFHDKYHTDSPNFRKDESGIWYRRYVRTVHIPNNAGYWMCQSTSNSTSSRVEWRTKDHHLAPTLEESVSLYLATTKQLTTP